ncbi:hypothetical protein EAG18_16445 [Pseudoalteromonas sp. J010]|uniref:hypothetical protein n=1 Tax=Pseudoalteromonas sp. J010 TaxID=998465 RepID=UPI000F647314|nr:hypothetical protein [Pseudoalteromonas sp. J010]RRS07512.1 hypothetical protein EAG18_16445 [Pseudoalteromonas sp. J010]
MKTISSSFKKLLLLVALILVAGFYGYSKYQFALTVSNDVKQLQPYGSEQLELIDVSESAKRFTVRIAVSGLEPKFAESAELQSYYSNIARNYVCQSDYFEPKFEEGHQISIEFSKADSAQTVYERASVIKSDCGVSRS